MSVWAKFLTGLPIVTGVSAYPLVAVVKNQDLSQELRRDIQQAIKKLFDEGYRDCTLISGYKGPGVLYVCWLLSADGSLTPTYFYYGSRDTNRKENNGFRKVTYISNAQGSRYLRLEDGETVEFKNSLYSNISEWVKWIENYSERQNRRQ